MVHTMEHPQACLLQGTVAASRVADKTAGREHIGLGTVRNAQNLVCKLRLEAVQTQGYMI